MADFRGPHVSVQGALNALQAEYVVHDHRQFAADIRSPADFAAALGYPVQRITKSLFLRGRGEGGRGEESYAVAVCSMDRKLDFKAAAAALGGKRFEVATPEDLQVKTGYPRHGVSPLGLAGDIAVVMDRPLLGYPTILIGGGAAGIEIELSPADLARSSRAVVENIAV